MTNYKNITESAKVVFKETAKSRKEYNTAYYSLSRLLRDTQSKGMLKITAPIFESLGLATNGKVKPSEIMEMLTPEQYVVETNKNGESTTKVVLWSHVQKTEKAKDGTIKKVFEADGTTPVMVDKSSKIMEGTWTLNKFVKLMAQRNAFAVAAAK